jgi:hypothetical protein
MAKKNRKTILSSFGFRFLLVTTLAAVSIFGYKSFVFDYNTNNVLGSQTYLASKGSDSSENEVRIEETNDAPKPTEIKPEDNHPENEVENESEIKQEIPQARENIQKTSDFSLNNLKQIQVRTESNKAKIKLDSKNGSFELENENGKIKIKAKDDNGSELELESESLDNINDALEDEGISIASSSGNNLRIKRGKFEAETHFPLSINPTTNTLTITTPAGIKDVAVLPDQAVSNLIRNKLIDRVASGSASENPTGIKLGLLNDKPVFQVLGSDDKKLFGLIPVSIDNTSFVSAENGEIVRVDKSLVSQILDLLSVQ